MSGDTHASPRVSLGELTYEGIHEVAGRDGSILVVPVGSLEQHGPHLPVLTDSVLAEEVALLGARRVAEEVPILVTPAFWTGLSPHHLPFGGTVSLSVDHMLDALEDVAETLLPNGFDALLFLNGHGGNGPVVGAALNTIGPAHPEVDVLSLMYFDLLAPHAAEIREGEVAGTHAGEIETALMTHLRPELVHEDRAEPVEHATAYPSAGSGIFDPGPLSVYRPYDAYTPTGSAGDPTAATAEGGERIFGLIGDELEAVLREVHEGAV